MGKNQNTTWDQFRSGDKGAFEKIYREHFRLLYNYGRQFTSDSDIVNDSIQGLFVDLWNSKYNLGPTDSIKFYLMRSFRRKIAREVKYNSRFSEFDNSAGFEMLFPYENELISREIDEEKKIFLNRSFEKLSKRKREVLFLKYYNGLDNEEISEVLSIKIKTVYNLIFDALEVLRNEALQTFHVVKLLATLIASTLSFLMI